MASDIVFLSGLPIAGTPAQLAAARAQLPVAGAAGVEAKAALPTAAPYSLGVQAWTLVVVVLVLGLCTIIAAARRHKATSPSIHKATSPSIRVGNLWSWLQQHTFVGAATVALGLTLSLIVGEALGEKNAVRFGSLVVMLLVVALCLQIGPSIIRRIKKIGPLELFEQGSELASSLMEQFDKLDRALVFEDGEPFQISGGEISPSHRFAFDQLYFCLSMVENTGKDLVEGERLRYCEILKVTASIALVMGDPQAPLKALTLLERLRRVSGGTYKAPDIASLLGYACIFASKNEVDAQRRKYLDQAAACFKEVVDASPDDYLAIWRLAFVQFELENYAAAVAYNRKVLEIRASFCPAKYNLAVSYLKNRQRDRALKELSTISPQDQWFENVKASEPKDKDLDPLRRDPTFQAIIARWRPPGTSPS
jgi:hypothetical protein